jgi:hypothetical protein
VNVGLRRHEQPVLPKAQTFQELRRERPLERNLHMSAIRLR